MNLKLKNYIGLGYWILAVISLFGTILFVLNLFTT
jgi:hypothetical protein